MAARAKSPAPATPTDFAAEFLIDAKRMRMKQDICYAFEQLTGKPPYDYQREYLVSNDRLKAIVKSRQTGLTFAMAFKVFWLTWTGGSENELVISVWQRASDTVMRYIKSFCYSVGIQDGEGAKVWRADQITFDNGCSIFSLPQSPSTIRSLHGNVRMDECAHYEHGRDILQAVLPFISRGYTLDAISTPLGCDALFYEAMWQNKHFTKTTIKWSDCPDLTEANLTPIWETMDEESRRQEYGCEFVDEATAYFTYQLIMSRVNSELALGQPPTYVGVDIGRKKDATEIIGLDPEGRTCYMQTLRNVGFREQKALLLGILHDRRTVRMCIDNTGIGMQLAEELLEEVGSKVEACTFNLDRKEMWATELHIAFEKKPPDSERKSITIPNNIDLINQIHAIKRKPTPTGVRFDVEENTKHHGDKFWALALAWYAGFSPTPGEQHLIENEELDMVI